MVTIRFGVGHLSLMVQVRVRSIDYIMSVCPHIDRSERVYTGSICVIFHV